MNAGKLKIFLISTFATIYMSAYVILYFERTGVHAIMRNLIADPCLIRTKWRACYIVPYLTALVTISSSISIQRTNS